MKKCNVVLQAAVVSALLVMSTAQAGTIGASNRSFAVEQFLGSTPAATALNLAPIAYQFGAPVSTQTIRVYVSLSGGATFAAGTVLVGQFTGAYSSGTAIAAASAVAQSTDGTFAVFTLNMAAGEVFNSTSVINFTPAAGQVVTANGALATAGGVINATMVIDSTLSTVTAPAGNIDSVGVRTAPVATSVQGITVTAAASSAFPFGSPAVGVPETARINLGASPISTLLTTNANVAGSTTLVNLGGIRAAQNALALTAGNLAYTIAGQTGATPLSYTLTAPAGFFAALGTTGTVHLNSALACTAGATVLATSTSAVFGTAAAAAAATVLTVTGAAQPVSGTNYYVCMTVNGTTAMVPGTPVLTATLAHTNTATDSNNTLAATNLYALATNGSTVDVRNYVPVAVTGWSTFLRVINTGAIAAEVRVALINETTGVVGTSGVLIASLAPGAATTLSPAQIEAVIGAQPAAARPRIRVTAPTNGLDVQNYVFTPNGNFSIIHGRE